MKINLKGRNREQMEQKYRFKLTSVIILNVNRLNAPVKRERLSSWIKKKKKSNYIILKEKRQLKYLKAIYNMNIQNGKDK